VCYLIRDGGHGLVSIEIVTGNFAGWLTPLIANQTTSLRPKTYIFGQATWLLALTFGTLLSSQGADAHPRRPLSRCGGNPYNLAGLFVPVKSGPLPGPRARPTPGYPAESA
jgi:hypothetical protein